MRENREPLLFVVCLMLFGGLTFLKIDDAYSPVRAPGTATYPAKDVERPPRVLLGGAEPSGERARSRSAFAPPRELLPLDPLVLPDPPVPLLAVRRPAVQPALAGAAARVYRVSSEELGDLVLEGGDDAGFDDSGILGVEGLSEPAAGDGAGLGLAGESDPSETYDWLTRSASGSRLYGRILNPDPHGLTRRIGEDIRFQQITLRTGRPLGLPFDVPRGEVASFGLARTFENDYILRSRALGTGAGSVAGRTDLALEMLAAADTEERALEFAEAEARLARDHSRADPFTARLLATILREAHDAEGQLAVYREALANDVVSAPLLVDHATLVWQHGLEQRAAELLEQAERLSRLAPEVHRLRGRMLAAEGRHAQALEALRQAGQGSFSPPFEDRQRRELALETGAALLALGRVADARREAERLLLADASDVGALRLLGASQAAEGELLDAAESFSSALLLAPEDADLLTNAGLVAWRLGDGREALRLLEQALRVDPFHGGRALVAMGFVHEDAGQGQVARDLYDQALRLEPGHPGMLYRLGRIQRLDGDLEGARSTLRKALRLGGPDVLLLAELGRVELGRGRHGAATRYFREALRLEPGSADLLWLQGLAQLLDGDVLTAVESLEQAVDGGEAGAHTALGVAHYRLGDEQKALDHFDEVGRVFAGRAEHVMAAFALQQAVDIRDNLSKRQWVDGFGRRTLQRGWTERQWDGSPRVFLGPEHLHVEGRMEKPRDDERPGIARTVEGRAFVSADVTVAGAPGTDSRYGLVLTHKQVKGVQGQLPKARLEIWVDASGQVRLSALDNFETVVLDGVALSGVRVPPDTLVTLGIERLDSLTGTFGFRVDGVAVGQPVALKALRDMTRNTLHLDVFADAPPGRSVDVDVTRVRIVQLP